MSKTMKILVVDDDRDHADSLAELLVLEGHDVEATYSGEDAVAAFKRTDFDLAFMDVMMPNMNGVESFLEIKRNKPNAQVIMMTGFSVDELIKQATDNGAVDALQKPLTPKSIVEALDSVAPSGIILVADDDENFGPMLKQMICDDGRSCELVTNGSLAIDRIGQGGIDSVILDLRMPLIDGLDVYKHLRESGIDVPTILITAYAEEYLDKINAEVDLDLTGILTKPFEPDDLLNKLPSLAGKRKPSCKAAPPV
jgi:CheY-like chemotaxis protein